MIKDVINNLGFVEDVNKTKLNEALKNNVRIKELGIDLYSSNPLLPSATETFMLLLRTFEKGIIVSNDGDRIVFRKNDRYKTHIANVLHSEIKECYVKHIVGCGDNCFYFVLNIKDVYYRIGVCGW